MQAFDYYQTSWPTVTAITCSSVHLKKHGYLCIIHGSYIASYGPKHIFLHSYNKLHFWELS